MLALTSRRYAPFLIAALLFSSAVIPSFAASEEEAVAEDVAGEAAAEVAAEGEEGKGDALIDSNILDRMKEFPNLGLQGAGLLKLAEEALGFNASKVELNKLVPMLIDLQKNVHDHYVVTMGEGKYKPSSLLKRVVSRKSQKKVLKSMKQFAPNTDDGELMQQLDVVTSLLHELHTNPHNSVGDLIKSVSNVVGFELGEEEMEHINSNMQWAQGLLQKVLPLFPEMLADKNKDEL